MATPPSSSASASAEAPFLLSICIPTWNRAKCLDQALEALAGSLEGMEDQVEIVVGDNASDDGTPEVARAWQKRFRHYRYIRRPHNVNSDNFWMLIREARGRYCWLHADDDAVYPQALPTILPHLRSGAHPYLYLNFDPYSSDLSRKLAGSMVDLKADAIGPLLDFTKKFGYIHGLPFLTASIFDRERFLSAGLEKYLRNDSYYPQCAVFLEAFGRETCRLIADPLVKYRAFHDHLESNVNQLYAGALQYARATGFVRNLELMLEQGIITTSWMGEVEERPPIGQIHTLFDTVWSHLHQLHHAWYRIPPPQMERLLALARSIPKPGRGKIVDDHMVRRELRASVRKARPCVYAWRPTRVLPLLSVILTVPERPNDLRLMEFIAAVRQTTERVEVIVVYSSRRPDSEVVEAFDAVAGPYDGARYEAGHCLNIGLRLARSPIVAAFAGDGALEAALVKQLAESLSAGPAPERAERRCWVLTMEGGSAPLEHPKTMFSTEMPAEINRYQEVPVPALFVFSRCHLIKEGGFEETPFWSKKSVTLWDAWFRISCWKEFRRAWVSILLGRPVLAENASSKAPDWRAAFLLLLRRLNRYPLAKTLVMGPDWKRSSFRAARRNSNCHAGTAPQIRVTLNRIKTKMLGKLRFRRPVCAPIK